MCAESSRPLAPRSTRAAHTCGSASGTMSPVIASDESNTMADEELQIVFRGELTGELPRDAVKRNLAGLFKLSDDRAEALLSGKPIVIRRGIDQATARKFESAFRKAGAVCEIRPAGDQGRAGTPSPTREAPAAKAAGDSTRDSGTPATRPQQAAGSTVSAGDPHGTVIDMAVPADVGSLALDDSDTPLQPAARARPPAIDTSGLELATDDKPLSETPRAKAPEIDTSGLSLEPPAP